MFRGGSTPPQNFSSKTEIVEELLYYTKVLVITNVSLFVLMVAYFILFAIFASNSKEFETLVSTGVKVEKELNEKASAATISMHNLTMRTESFVNSHSDFFTVVDDIMSAMEVEDDDDNSSDIHKNGEKRGHTSSSSSPPRSKKERVTEIRKVMKYIKTFPSLLNETITLFLDFTHQLENSDLIHSITRTSNLTSSIEEKLLDLFSK